MKLPVKKEHRRPFWMTPFEEETPWDVWFERMMPDWMKWRRGEFLPSFDFSEKEGKYFLTAELPGVTKDDISIHIDRNVVTVSGKKESTHEQKEADYYLKESTSGSFSRSIRLPEEVEEDKVEAVFKDGVLTLTMPHKNEPKAKKIEVKG